MNDLEKQLHYPLGEALPTYGTCITVAPGVKWLRMDLPFALNHINLWLLRDCVDGVDGWSIVDTCIHREEAKAHWEAVFAQELDGLPVLRVFATHMHPDHIGLADWLCARWNAPWYISATDFMVATIACSGMDTFSGERTVAFYARHGLNDAETARKLLERKPYFTTLVPSVPKQFHRLFDGGTLQIGDHAWTCISGHGHAPEHMALYCAELGVLIGGDMMLPRISTNVSVYEQEPEADALTLFLASINRFSVATRRHAGAALPRQAVYRPACAHPAIARPPPGTPGRGVAGLHREALQRGRCVARVVQAAIGLSPDYFCPGRGGGAFTCAVAWSAAQATAGGRWRLPLLCIDFVIKSWRLAALQPCMGRLLEEQNALAHPWNAQISGAVVMRKCPLQDLVCSCL